MSLPKSAQAASIYSRLSADEFRVLILRDPSDGQVDGDQAPTIECELCTVNADTTLAYTALSYTWGDAGHTSTIKVNGSEIGVQRNLAQALNGLQRLQKTILWVDALCINQDDISEKNVQIRLMPTIYSKAQEVAIWLEFLSDSCTGTRRAYKDNDDCYATFENIERILRCSFWQRAWILQEIALASKVNIIFRERAVGWNEFLASKFLGTDKRRDLVSALSQESSRQRGVNKISVLSHLRERKGQSLLTVLALTRGSQQQDPRDAIYSKLGLSRDAEKLVPAPDYNEPVREVYLDLVQHYIALKDSLDIICFGGLNDHSNGQDELKLPSWIPDWRIADSVCHLHGVLGVSSPDLLFQAASTIAAYAHIYSFKTRYVLAPRGFCFDVMVSPGEASASTHTEQMSISPLAALGLFFRTSSANHFICGSEDQASTIPQPLLEWFVSLLYSRYMLSELRVQPNSTWSTMAYLDQKVYGKDSYLSTFFTEHKDMQFFGSTLGQWLESWAGTCLPPVPPDGPRDVDDLVKSIRIMMCGRKLVVGQRRQPFLVPKSTAEGDLICILAGCSVPVVLRPCEGAICTLIGECYVDGIMHGEAMREHLKHSDLDTFSIV